MPRGESPTVALVGVIVAVGLLLVVWARLFGLM